MLREQSYPLLAMLALLLLYSSGEEAARLWLITESIGSRLEKANSVRIRSFFVSK